MEYHDKKPRKRRTQREEIGRQLLADSIIGEIDRLDAIGKQTEHTAETYRQIFNDLKGYKLQIDTEALDAKEKEFTAALAQQVKQIRVATRTVRTALWLLIVMLFLCFAQSATVTMKRIRGKRNICNWCENTTICNSKGRYHIRKKVISDRNAKALIPRRFRRPTHGRGR